VEVDELPHSNYANSTSMVAQPIYRGDIFVRCNKSKEFVSKISRSSNLGMGRTAQKHLNFMTLGAFGKPILNAMQCG
jgi:hypothetical protein